MRCYNGWLDNDLQALLDSRQAARHRARQLGCVIVWFPVEERYSAHQLEFYAEASPMCRSAEECVPHIEAFVAGRTA